MADEEDDEDRVATFEELLHHMILCDPRLREILDLHGVHASNVLVMEVPRKALEDLVNELFSKSQRLSLLVEDLKRAGALGLFDDIDEEKEAN